HNRHLHRNEWAYTQIQLPPLHWVEGWILMASPAAKAWHIGVTQRAVIGHPCLLPGTHGQRMSPTQVVHAPAPLCLLNALLSADCFQALNFRLNKLSPPIGFKTRVQTNFMSTTINLA